MIEKIIALFREKLEIIETVILTPETRYGEIEEWDSFGHITILSAIEKEFGISLTYDEISQIESIGDICDILERRGIN